MSSSALGLRLRDVAIPRGDVLNGVRERVLGQGRRRRGGGSVEDSGEIVARLDEMAQANRQRVRQPRPRLRRVERQQYRQRVTCPAGVVALVLE